MPAKDQLTPQFWQQELQNSKELQLNNQITQNLIQQSLFNHEHDIKSMSQNLKIKIEQTQQNTQKKTTYDKGGQIQNTGGLDFSFVSKQVFEPLNLNNSANQFTTQEQARNKLLLKRYFQQISKSIQEKKLQKVIRRFSNKIQQSLEKNISTGAIRIQSHKYDIQNLLQQFKVSQEQLKVLQRKTLVQLRNQKIKLVDPYYLRKVQMNRTKEPQDNSIEKSKFYHMVSSSVLSKQQHQKLIRKFLESNRQSQQRQKCKVLKQMQRQKSFNHEKKVADQQKQKRQKQSRRLQIQRKLIYKKKEHQSFIVQEKVSNQRYHSLKKQKLLYQNMEQKYKSQILIPSLQEKKMKLKQIREFNKKFEIQEIKKHQLQYLQKKSQSGSKINSRHKIASFHYVPPERSRRLTQFLQQQKTSSIIKMQQKRRVTEENRQRQINFLSQIRVKHRPIVDFKKRQEIKLRLKSEQSETVKKLAQKDLKLLGDKYLQEAKKWAKKKKQKIKTQGADHTQKQEQKEQFTSTNVLTKTRPNEQSSRDKQSKEANGQVTPRPKRKRNLYQYRRKQIRKLIESEQFKREQKLQKLKIQNRRISQIYNRKERFFNQNQDDQQIRQQAIGLLLNSIQAKIAIIDICTKQ